jgi:hypothetical protein
MTKKGAPEGAQAVIRAVWPAVAAAIAVTALLAAARFRI